MEEKVFEVTLQVSSQSEYHLLKVGAESMAFIIRNAIRSKSPSIIIPTSFKITVKDRDEIASATAEIGRYVPEQFNDMPDDLVTNPVC